MFDRIPPDANRSEAIHSTIAVNSIPVLLHGRRQALSLCLDATVVVVIEMETIQKPETTDDMIRS